MKFCPFISTENNKKNPSPQNCKDCYFYVLEKQTQGYYCAILLAAERASNTFEMLNKR